MAGRAPSGGHPVPSRPVTLSRTGTISDTAAPTKGPPSKGSISPIQRSPAFSSRPQSWKGLIVHLAELSRCWLVQQGRVERRVWEQVQDEALLGRTQPIGICVGHSSEVAAEGVPERAPALRVDGRSHLRQYRSLEGFGVAGDEREATPREQLARLPCSDREGPGAG